MLRLRETIAERAASVRVGDHEPLRIKFQPSVISIDEAFSWRGTDSNYLFEIQVHAKDGALAEVGLVLVPDERVLRTGSLNDVSATKLVKKGLPCFDTALWKDKIGSREIGIEPSLRRKDEQSPFKLFVAADGVAVLLDGVTAVSAIRNQSIDVMFNSNDELCGVMVRDSKVGKDAGRLLRSRGK